MCVMLILGGIGFAIAQSNEGRLGVGLAAPVVFIVVSIAAYIGFGGSDATGGSSGSAWAVAVAAGGLTLAAQAVLQAKAPVDWKDVE